MENIKKRTEHYAVPRFISIISKRLNMKFQPNRGSSFYKRPSEDKRFCIQKDWNSPFGTLRLSDHWDYINSNRENVYRTDVDLTKKVWALCINTGNRPESWKVLEIFKEGEKINIIRNIDFKKIQLEIDEILK